MTNEETKNAMDASKIATHHVETNFWQVMLGMVDNMNKFDRKINRIKQINAEIDWLKNQMCDSRMSGKQMENYKHQIRHKEIELAYLNS